MIKTQGNVSRGQMIIQPNNLPPSDSPQPNRGLSHLLAAWRFAFLIALCLLAFAGPARADPGAFQSYTQSDGLAADYVTSIAFTSPSGMWIGTPDGATNVQDKYWVTYTAAHGLGSSSISSIAVRSDGKVVFGTNGGGLTVFDSTRKTYDLSNSQIPSNFITAVAADKQMRLWVGTYGAGVGRLEAEVWTKYSLANNYINAIAVDASGNPWAATNDGAFFFDGKTWTRFTQSTGLASTRVYGIAIAPDGKIWFATDGGLTSYDGRTYRSYKEADGLASNIVHAVAVDGTRVWAGTQKGLSVLESGKWKSYHVADGLPSDEITTLALDARGSVWVGTTKGMAVLAAQSTVSTALQRATSLPVVLVHGWHGPDSDRLEDSEFRYLAQYMERDGITAFYAAGISPSRTLFQNAETLNSVIADVKTKTGAKQVDLIAFSMGGLNARAYLESTFYQNDVRRAIILGTPQAGVRMWYPLLTREIEDRPTEPSTIELTPEYADLFNRTHMPSATVPYDLLAGDARSQQGLDLLKILPPSDGLIEEWSAHALNGPLVRHIANSDVHAWNPTPVPFDITSYLYPQQTYDRFLRNALRDPDVRPIGFSAPAVAPIQPRNITPMNVDTLKAGDAVTHTVDIDAARAVRFFARWTAGEVTMSLRAPDGTRYTPDDFHSATYLKADIGSFIGYSLPKAQAGTWYVSVSRTDKGSDQITATTYADLDSDLRLNVGTDKSTYALGSSVVVTATLSNKATGADVRGRLEWLGDGTTPRGASTEFKFLEEGDAGNYAETLTNLPRGGYYLLRITAKGNGFARERELVFSVSTNAAKLGAGATLSAAGTAGHYSALTINAPVEVGRAGAFAVSAILKDSKGQALTAITSSATLATGKQTMTVSIPGRELRARSVDGPYTVDLILMDANWSAVQIDQSLKVLTTDAYRASDFE